QGALELEELPGIVERLGDQLRRSTRALRGTREDQRRPLAACPEPETHARCIAFAAAGQRALEVRQSRIGPARLGVPEQDQPLQAQGSYKSPASSCASSDIMERSHGGSNTSSTVASSTVGMISTFCFTSS